MNALFLYGYLVIRQERKDMEDTRSTPPILYEDGDISIYDLDMRALGLPRETGPQKTDKLIFAASIEGRLQVDINGKKHEISDWDVLICPFNAVLDNVMLSPSFRGRIICLSRKMVMECVHMDSNIWNRAFRIAENPVIHIEEPELLETYGKLLTLRLGREQRPYRREIIASIIRTCIYEILAEVEKYVESSEGKTLTQGDILFKRFVKLISGTKVKPRAVSWYGEQLCVTAKYLSTVCKMVSGKTACEWINQFVITDIQHLLKYSEMSIKEISEYLDFPNISFFGKYVKSHLGYSPKEYRRKIRDSRAQ